MVIEPHFRLADTLNDSLRTLSQEERDAFILTELRGLPVRDAALVIGTSKDTVHRRAEVARNFVKGALSSP